MRSEGEEGKKGSGEVEPGRVERIREKKRSGSRILTLEEIEDHRVGLPIFRGGNQSLRDK